MKTDINVTLNKLIAYAQDNLMLDSLDAVYTLNKLARLAGVEKPVQKDVDYGDATLKELLDELVAAAPMDAVAVTDMLLPLPHTVNYYFNDEFGRSPKKAFAFIYDLFCRAGSANCCLSGESGGYYHYCTGGDGRRAVMLSVGSDDLKYTPLAEGSLVASLECKDFMSDDIAAREAAFADAYGMAIAKTMGGDGDYMCCEALGVANAPVKQKLSDGVVKVALLDYPVPALSVTGPKNSTVREAARLVKAAAEKDIPCVLACKSKEWTSFYIVFAKPTEASDIYSASTALSACGVFGTAKLDELLPILEKGTALPSDMFAFKAVYGAVGGAKLGAKAADALSEEIVKNCKKTLGAAASCTEAELTALAQEKNDG